MIVMSSRCFSSLPFVYCLSLVSRLFLSLSSASASASASASTSASAVLLFLALLSFFVVVSFLFFA